MTDNVAVLQGFTDEYFAYDKYGNDIHILVKPDANKAEVFRAWDCDNQTFIRIHGWLFNFERITKES